MRQFRRQTPTPTFLTALRALAGVLVAAAVISAPVHISAQAPEAARPARPAPAPAGPAAPAARSPRPTRSTAATPTRPATGSAR